MGRRLRPRWRFLLVASGLVLAFASIAVTMLNNQSWQADRHYREAVAEADRLDPGWRLDKILAQRVKIPDKVNSSLKVRGIVEQLPGGWPGIRPYDASYSFGGETPEVRLSKETIDQLKDALEAAAELVPQTRLLAEYPNGQVDGTRPRAQQLERVGNLNAYVDVNFPYGEELNRVLFLLWLDAKLRIEAGDTETAILDLRAMSNAGRSIGDYPGFSAQLSRSGAFLRAIPCLETALAQGEARGSSLAALQSILDDEARQSHRTIALRGERAVRDDLVEQIHAGNAGFREIPGFSQYPFVFRTFTNHINLRENQAAVLHFHTRAALVGRQPEAEQIGSMKALNDEWTKQAVQWGILESNRRLTEKLLLGSVTGIPTWLGMNDALVRTAIAGLAAERFRLDHGRWPESLEQLVPIYLSAVPRDPFVDSPLKLLKLPDGLFVYSVGYDGHDDGGKINPRLRMRDGADTGFRLWDPGRRRRPAPAAGTAKE